MADKSMNMLLTIGAVFQGEQAFAAIRKSAGSTANAIKKIALETAGILIGFKAIQSVSNFFGGAIKEAQEARAATEKLGVALARNPKIAAKGADVVLARQQQLVNLANEMERTNLLAATSMTEAFAGLAAAGFSPEQIERSAKGMEGLGIAIKGVAATGPEMADLAKSIQIYIKTGRIGELRRFFDPKQLANLKNFNNEQKRGTEVMKVLERQSWRVDAALTTTAGKIAKSAQNWKRVQQIIGEPFIDTQLAFTQMWGEVALAIEPVSREIAGALTPAMADLAKWIREDVSPAMEGFGPVLKGAFDWIRDNWEPISKGLAAIGVAAGTLGVFAIISNPITLTVAALAALAGAVITVVENWHLIGPAIDSAGQAILKSTEWLWKPIAGGLEKVWPEIDAELKRIPKLIMSFISGEIDWTALWSTLGRSASRIGDALGKVEWGKVVEEIGTSIKNAVGSIDWSGIASAIGTGISNAASTVGGALASINWSGVAEAIGHGIGTALKLIAWAAFILPQDIHNAFVGVVRDVNWADVGTKTIELLGQAFNNALTAGKFLGEMGVSIVKGLVTSLAGADWGSVAAAFVRGMGTVLASLLKEAASWGPKILDAIKGSLGALGGWVMGQVQKGATAGATAAVPAGAQYGGLVSNPSLMQVGEAGPEMIIPLNNKQRSQGLLAQTANMMGMSKGGGGEQNVSLNMPITVNGAQAGQEASIAREIERAMQDPIRNLLDQLKEARDEERRLAYV